MNDDDQRMVVLGTEVGGAGRLLSIVYRNEQLEGRVAELEEELAEERAKRSKDHEDFRMVQGLLSDAEAVIRDNPGPTHEAELVLEDVWNIIRSIRSIVG